MTVGSINRAMHDAVPYKVFLPSIGLVLALLMVLYQAIVGVQDDAKAMRVRMWDKLEAVRSETAAIRTDTAVIKSMLSKELARGKPEE